MNNNLFIAIFYELLSDNFIGIIDAIFRRH